MPGNMEHPPEWEQNVLDCIMGLDQELKSANEEHYRLLLIHLILDLEEVLRKHRD